VFLRWLVTFFAEGTFGTSFYIKGYSVTFIKVLESRPTSSFFRTARQVLLQNKPQNRIAKAKDQFQADPKIRIPICVLARLLHMIDGKTI
jgi:hypothetical protein